MASAELEPLTEVWKQNDHPPSPPPVNGFVSISAATSSKVAWTSQSTQVHPVATPLHKLNGTDLKSPPSYTTRSLVARVGVTAVLRTDWLQRN